LGCDAVIKDVSEELAAAQLRDSSPLSPYIHTTIFTLDLPFYYEYRGSRLFRKFGNYL
jgi:hypothetical protein